MYRVRKIPAYITVVLILVFSYRPAKYLLYGRHWKQLKIERTKNARRNIVYGIILKVVLIVVPFFIRTALIYFMGVQYLGLNSLFSSILQVLNLAELGVSTAMVFSMYKPIAEDDTVTICALMKLYKFYYRFIGAVIAAIGLILLPFIPKLIRGDVPPDINIYILYLLHLAATVLSYWMFAYKASVFQAHQRLDMTSKIGLISSCIRYALQFLVLWLFKNYYYFVAVILLTQIIHNIAVAMMADKYYPNYRPAGKLADAERKKINQKIVDLFTAKIGFVVNTSVDPIIISAYLGLTTLGIYNNYYYIMTSVMGFIVVVFDSISAGIANSLITETKEKNFNDLKKLTFIIFWIVNICSCCLLCLYQPFMRMWVGDELMLTFGHVVMITVLFCVQTTKRTWVVVKDAAGIWHQDRYRPLIVAGCNLIINIILVSFIGLYGIMLSTILAEALISVPWLLYIIFRHVIPGEYKQYIIEVIKYVFVLTLTSALCVWICSLISISNIFSILIYAIICLFISNGIQMIVFHETIVFKETKEFVLKRLCSLKTGLCDNA